MRCIRTTAIVPPRPTATMFVDIPTTPKNVPNPLTPVASSKLPSEEVLIPDVLPTAIKTPDVYVTSLYSISVFEVDCVQVLPSSLIC
jgi:hypothetical protein